MRYGRIHFSHVLRKIPNGIGFERFGVQAIRGMLNMVAQFGLLVFIMLSGGMVLPVQAEVRKEASDAGAFCRVEIGNDAFLKEDSNFTSGLSIQFFDDLKAADGENFGSGNAFNWPLRWVNGNRKSGWIREGYAVGQLLVTPGDLQAETWEEGELPYGSTLTLSKIWQFFNEQEQRALQLTAGLLGDESAGGRIQEFVHSKLGLGQSPEGWDTQRETELLLNLAIQYKRKLWRWGVRQNDWSGSLLVASGGQFGNLMTGLDTSVALRWGWNLPVGFSPEPAPPGVGIADGGFAPLDEGASSQSLEFDLSLGAIWIAYSVIYDGSMLTSDDRKVERKPGIVSLGITTSYQIRNRFTLRVGLVFSSPLLENIHADVISNGSETRRDVSYGSIVIEIPL